MRNVFTGGIAVLIIFFLAACYSAANAHFLPPPPVVSSASSQSTDFTESDRKTLKAIYAYSRSIRAKLFPYQEEQNILELRQ